MGALLLVVAAGILALPLPEALTSGARRVRPRWKGALSQRTGRGGPYVAAVLTGLVAAAAAGLVAGVLVGAVAGVGLEFRRAATAAAVAERKRAAGVEMVSVLVAELRAGRPAGAALAAAGGVPGCEPLGAAARAVSLGADVTVALRDIAIAAPLCAAVERVAIGWQVAERSGVRLAEIFAGVENDLRAAIEVRRRVREELAGTRATVVVLVLLPVVGLLLGTAMGAHPLKVLLHTPIGAGCALLGLAFEVAGALWIRRLTRTAEGAP